MCPFAVEFFASALDAREGAPENRHIVASCEELAWLEDFEIETVGERLKEEAAPSTPLCLPRQGIALAVVEEIQSIEGSRPSRHAGEQVAAATRTSSPSKSRPLISNIT